jgi:hypothetical protein
LARLHALLVGINTYKSEKLRNYPLKGCLNDIARLTDVLHQLFPSNAEVQRLTESEATRAGILDAFRSQLIEPARTWANSGRPEPAPAFLFHFSGHGSLARDATGLKPSGFDETIVPYDSRQADIFDLRDWELGALIDELGQFTHNITIVLDCCHSGSGTRSSGRMCEPDLRVPAPVHRTTSLQTPSSGLRSGASDKMTDYVLLAACDAKQIAEEYHDSSAGEVCVYGAMTYALTDVLLSLNSQVMTYRELHELIHDKVRSWYPSQSPQCEGDRDRLLWDLARAERGSSFSVVTSADQECTIDAGLVHGFANGDEFDVYASHVRTRTAEQRPIARLRISNAGVVGSQCQILSGQSPVPVRSRVPSIATKLKEQSSDLFARHQSVLRIRNTQASVLQGHVVCEILRLKATTPPESPGHDVYESLVPDAQRLHHIDAGTAVCFSVTNNSNVALYCQILSLGYDGSVTRIWPKLTGEQVALEPGRTVRTSRFRLRFHPDDKTTLQAREFIKVFAATVPFDVDMLCSGTRSADTLPAFKEDWMTTELAYEFNRPAIT